MLLSADMAGENRTSTPQERLLMGRAEKRKAAEPPAPSSQRPVSAPQITVGSPGSAPVPRPEQCVPGAVRWAQPPVPRESQLPVGAASRGGASASVATPPVAGSGSRHGRSPPRQPQAISSSHLLELGRRCRRPDLSSVDSLHAGLSYLGKVRQCFCLYMYVYTYSVFR